MVMSSKKKFGMYSPEKKPEVLQCDTHEMPYLSSQGCIYCRTAPEPDPKR